MPIGLLPVKGYVDKLKEREEEAADAPENTFLPCHYDNPQASREAKRAARPKQYECQDRQDSPPVRGLPQLMKWVAQCGQSGRV
jgi:hypothetical protein